MKKPRIQLDDIIFNLQKFGGASVFWQELSKRLDSNDAIQVKHTTGLSRERFFPVLTNADIFHSSHFRIGLGPAVKNVVTIHDLHYELGFIKTWFPGKLANLFHRWQGVFFADAIVCVSHSTKKDLTTYFPKLERTKPIYVIHHGNPFSSTDLDPQCCVNSDKINSAISKCPQGFILFVGGRNDYKRFKEFIQGFRASLFFGEKVSIVCTGSELSDHETRFLQDAGVFDRVHVLSGTTKQEMIKLYRSAILLAYPSAYEGFGFPPLEAMTCGCPVLACHSSSIPEVVGDAGLLVDTHTPDVIASALNTLHDQAVRNVLIEKGLIQSMKFAWQSAAQQYISVYNSLSGL